MKKLKAVGALYFLLLITTIFLVIQTRISLSQEEISAKELKSPALNTQRKINENEWKIEQAIQILTNHYDKYYNLIHDYNSLDTDSRDFIVFKDWSDDTIKKSDFNISEIIVDETNASQLLYSLQNESTEFNTTTQTGNIFDNNLTSIYTKLGISNIKIPIMVSEKGKTNIFSPMLKISKVKEYEVDKQVSVAKVDISILLPYQVENKKTKVYFKEYQVNTNEIISNKIKVSYDILDYIANVIITKQKYVTQNAENLVNVLAPRGGAIKMYNPAGDVSVALVGTTENIGIMTSGLVYLNVGNLVSYPNITFPSSNESSMFNQNELLRGLNYFVPISGGTYPNDKFEIDFREQISLNLQNLNLRSNHNNSGGNQLIDSLYNENYLDENNITSDILFDENEPYMFCSLNSKCGIEITENNFTQIIEVNNIKTADALKKMFSIFDRDLIECNIENGASNSYLMKSKKNPFAVEFKSDCGSQMTDFLIDNSSSLNFGADIFTQETNLMIFTLAFKNDLTYGCEKCKKFPFIYKKYFISKN